MYAGITTVELDTLAAEIAAAMTTKHCDYGILAARIAISNLHKETRKKFSGKIQSLIFIFFEFFLAMEWGLELCYRPNDMPRGLQNVAFFSEKL